MTRQVPSTEFQSRAGLYFEESAKEPVVITKYNRPARVLMDITEYERLKKLDTRETLYAWELTDKEIKGLSTDDYGPVDPELEKLMK